MNRILLLLSACMFVACGPSTPDPSVETAKTGSITVLVDDQIIDLVRPAVALFGQQHPYSTITLQPVSAREAVSRLFAQEAKGIIVARDYLADESAFIKDRQQTFPRTHIATDALVFFAGAAYPHDTISAEEIHQHLMGQGGTLSGITFVTAGANSSLVANIINVVGNGRSPAANLSALSDVPTVRKRVASSPSLIGIGYLSQLHNAKDVKLLRVGFTDSTGKRVSPKPVHQAYVVQSLYPYPVPIFTYLKDKPSMHNLASGLFGFLYQEKTAQQTFLNAGIVPEFAKIVLVPEGQN